MPEFSQDPGRSLALQVSDAVVALLRDYTGRGPVSARTTIDRDAVYVLMRGALTKGETVLADAGHQDEVLSSRRAFQAAMSADLTAVVERLLGREVEAFMSSNHASPDWAVEVFVLGDPIAPPAPVAEA